MPRSALLALACLTFALLPACGGGGGGDGPSDPGAPGTLRALAVEGEPAPGTAGNFAALPTFPYMDAAKGGWCAFVAPTTDGTKTQVLYVAQPDAIPTIVDVYAVGEMAPPPSDGTISGFQGVWMCEDGSVACLVTLAGDSSGRTFGLLTATVNAGVAGAKIGTLYDKADLSTAALAGNALMGGVLGGIDAATLLKQDDGTLWFLADDTTGGLTHLLSVGRTGTGLTRRMSPGDPADGTTVASVDAFGVDPTGAFYGVALTTALGDRRMRLRESSGGINAEFLKDTDALPSGGGTFVDAYGGGRIVVFGAGQVVWMAKGSLGASDDVMMFYGHFLATNYVVLARVTLTAPGTGAGTWNSLDLLNMAPGCLLPQFDAGVTGGTSGVTRGTFGVADTAPTVGIISGNLVATSMGVVPAAYLSLRQTTRPYDEVSRGGDEAFVLVYAGTSALFWYVPGFGTYAVAAQGGPAPGGDTFDAWVGSAAHTVANGVVLFRARLTTAGTGIFRQGP